MSYLTDMSHGTPPTDKRKSQLPEGKYDPNRNEMIVLTFRDSGNINRATKMKLRLPSRYALMFHWWMITQGITKA